MARPFLVVGAMKAGTTTLYELLSRHPDVDLVVEKEANALTDPARCSRMADAVQRSAGLIAGEVTAGYMQAPLVLQPVERAQLMGEDLMIVAILRDPFERALSHWEHWTQIGREARPVDVALCEPDSPYLAFSSYARQLEPWVKLVGLDRCLVLRLEDYEAEPGAVVARLCHFLGLPSLTADEGLAHANQGLARVVATGRLRRVRESPTYRRFLRPLLSPGMRRHLAALAGGGRGRVAARPDAALRGRFLAALAPDRARLHEMWPEVVW
jgi:hypothetical protein